MAVTQVVYTGNGSLKIFTITFPYANRDDVKVFVNNVAVTAFVFLNDNQVELATAPPAGATVLLVRQTDVDDPVVEYFTGSPVRAADINLSYAQALYSLQEWRNQSVQLYYGAIPTNSILGINFDTLVQPTQPAGTSWRVGKGWLKNDGSNEFYIWDGTTWQKTCCGEGGGGGIFTPASLNPLRWYKANDALTVQLTGGTVSGWLDKSGNGAHLSQSTVAEQPSYSLGGMNGQNAIDWGSTANNKHLLNASNITAREVWVVCKADIPDSYFPDYIGLLSPGINQGPGSDPILSAGGIFSNNFLYVGGTTPFSIYINGNHFTNAQSSGVFPAIKSPCIVRQIFDTPITTGGGILVGVDRSLTLNRGWRGMIGEILVFPNTLNFTDANNLVAFLKNQWGIL